MKKLFLIIAFILAFVSTSFGQVEEPAPIVVDENTATEQVETFNEYFLHSITIELSRNSKYDDCRIILVAGIGKRLIETDPITGFKLTNVVETREIYNGTLASYRDSLLSRGVVAGLITEQQKTDIVNGQIAIYLATDQGFKTTLNLLIGLGDFEAKAIKKLVP